MRIRWVPPVTEITKLSVNLVKSPDGFKLKELGVNLGYKCNFHCAHCSVLEDPRIKLSPSEINLLAKTLRHYNFRSLLFVGGEPTLYINIANRILLKAGDLSKTSVKVTTNGHFAGSREKAIKTLSMFSKLDAVQLSYDKFHARFLPFGNIKHLFDACKVLGKKFNVISAIEDPMEVLLAEKLKKAGRFNIAVQKVLPVGRARLNGIRHPFPSLDRNVLNKSCPNRDKIMYFCGRGFSSCCSSLVFNSNYSFVIHPNVESHLKSDFYESAVLSTFGRLARKLGVSAADLKPEHSMPCNLCEYLFRLAAIKTKFSGGCNVRSA